MKRYTICWLIILIIVLCIGTLAACSATQVVDGSEVEVIDNRFAIIEEIEYGNYVVYDINTRVVLYIETAGHGGYLTPYQIYKDGAIYGAVYENGQIVAKPYAMGITEEMIGNYFDKIFG